MKRIAIFAALLATTSMLMLACQDSGTEPNSKSSGAAASTGSIDGSSAEAFTKSFESMKTGLDKETQKSFEIAVMALTLTVGGDNAKLRSKLDGKSVSEVIAMSDDLK